MIPIPKIKVRQPSLWRGALFALIIVAIGGTFFLLPWMVGVKQIFKWIF